MTLFFETEQQGLSFLLMCGVGFGTAVLLNLLGRLSVSIWGPIGDVLAFLLTAAVVMGALLLLREERARLYHWLGLLVGALLYASGLRRALRALAGQMRKRQPLTSEKQENPSSSEGDAPGASNDYPK